jgi:putative PIG3 family NAD(P)H quinone oxidoreductase
MAEQMLAVEIEKPGGPEVLRAVEVPIPAPRAGEVLIKVAAAGVNRPDCLQRAGHYPVPADASPLPGLEVAGEVVAAGDNVQRWRVGERVVALTHGGGYAQFCTAHEGHCLPWPDNCDAVAAAALPETCFTVHYNVFTRARLKAGEWLLVHGGSSGIGTTAIQLATAAGARVITTAGSDQKCVFCEELGAARAINYKTQEWPDLVRETTDGYGVDVVLDMVAGPYVSENLKLLAPDGRYAMIAFLLGAKAEVNFGYVLGKRLTITGSTLRPQSVEQKSAIAKAVEAEVWPRVVGGQLRSVIHETFGLAQAAQAHALMESSRHIGKIVLRVSDD